MANIPRIEDIQFSVSIGYSTGGPMRYTIGVTLPKKQSLLEYMEIAYESEKKVMIWRPYGDERDAFISAMVPKAHLTVFDRWTDVLDAGTVINFSDFVSGKFVHAGVWDGEKIIAC